MRQMTEIGAEPNQSFNVIGENNERITMVLKFLPSQQSWYMDLLYEDFEINGLKVVNNPNLLRQYQNIIPFGINCVVKDGTDPYYLSDFRDGRCVINLLNETDVQQIEDTIFG